MTGPRSIARALVVAVALAGAIAAAACGPIDDSGYAADVERELDRGRSYAAELVSGTRTEADVEAAIAVGYLERLRLGLGSPFRLIEQSLQDPRLEKADRERLAWALLARTADGQSYRVDRRALGVSGEEEAKEHLELIEGAIRGSSDPDGGVLAVRLAYASAAAEGRVSEAVRDRVSRASALVRDRIRSRADAERLLRAAGDTDPLLLVAVWRAERAFEVEQPARLTLPAPVERDAIALAPRLVRTIREIGRPVPAGPVAGEPADPVAHPTVPEPRPLLSRTAAALLSEASAAYDAPPQTPVAVSVDTYRRADRKRDPATDRFYARSVNEERLAAEHARLWHEGEVASEVRAAVLMAAVGLRAYAQERPWFPGFEGPARQDLEDRFGLASVEFPSEVPAHWRPYYRRMLESALSDLQRVLPSLDVRGLNVRFEARRESPGTLAVHDPGSRTMYIPAHTGAGTLAHEIAHDLDWQTALRRYRVRGDYATDRAVRLSDPRLSRVLRGLTASSLPQPVSLDHSAHATRPAEVFARSIDWFATVALAREGRMNGYLSSVQDDVLTGYGTVTPPDVTGTAGQALITLLDEVAPVYPETRRWFLGSYGRLRAPTAYDLARRLVEAPIGADPTREPGLSRVALALESLAALDSTLNDVLGLVEGACTPVAYDNGATDARRRLVRQVAESRAKGIARATAREVAGDEGLRWLEARLQGRTLDPAPPEQMVDALEPLAAAVEGLAAGPASPAPLTTHVPPAACAPQLFPAAD